MAISPEYAAGFFDGEGCVTFAVSRYRYKGLLRSRSLSLRVMIGNCDFTILQEFQLTWGGNIYKKARSTNPRAKDAWTWHLTCSKATPFLRDIAAHVRVKRRQVELALEFVEWRARPRAERLLKTDPGHGTWKRSAESIARENYYKDQIHELNRRGVPEAKVRNGDHPRVSISGVES